MFQFHISKKIFLPKLCKTFYRRNSNPQHSTSNSVMNFTSLNFFFAKNITLRIIEQITASGHNVLITNA